MGSMRRSSVSGCSTTVVSFARFDHFIQITQPASAHRLGERAITPAGVAAGNQVAAHQIGSGQIIMARHGKQRQPQLRGHMSDKAGFAAAGGAFDQHGSC